MEQKICNKLDHHQQAACLPTAAKSLSTAACSPRQRIRIHLCLFKFDLNIDAVCMFDFEYRFFLTELILQISQLVPLADVSAPEINSLLKLRIVGRSHQNLTSHNWSSDMSCHARKCS
jgi:hypothetical protein